MKNPRKISITALTQGISSAIPISTPEAKCSWADGKATEKFENIVFELVIKQIGACQVQFPYREGLIEKLSETVVFGTALDLHEIGSVEDITVSLYKEALNIKILMAE